MVRVRITRFLADYAKDNQPISLAIQFMLTARVHMVTRDQAYLAMKWLRAEWIDLYGCGDAGLRRSLSALEQNISLALRGNTR